MVCASGEVSTRNSLLLIAFMSINLFHTWWGARHRRAPCRRDTWRSASANHQYSPCGTHACREGIAACLPVWTPPCRWHIWRQKNNKHSDPNVYCRMYWTKGGSYWVTMPAAKSHRQVSGILCPLLAKNLAIHQTKSAMLTVQPKLASLILHAI